jgi:methionine synthase I (cobalamin-dependent)
MSRKQNIFREFVQASHFILLPSAVGTSLQQKGYKLKHGGWNRDANLTHQALVRDVHRDFLDAGAHIVTTNTYRTHGVEVATQNAVGEARAVAKGSVVFERPVFVGGSIGSIGDSHSFNPETAHRLQTLISRQTAHAKLLADLGVDILCWETTPTVNEAFAGAQAASQTGLPFTISFALDKGGLLFDKGSLKNAVDAIKQYKPTALLINCTPVDRVGAGLSELLECFDGPVGAYANAGHPHENGVEWCHDERPESIHKFIESVKQWNNLDPSRVKILGGCCGASLLYIAALSDALYEKYPAQRRIDWQYAKHRVPVSVPA